MLTTDICKWLHILVFAAVDDSSQASSHNPTLNEEYTMGSPRNTLRGVDTDNLFFT